MNGYSRILKPIMPILAAVYGLMLIYVTAMPMADGNESLSRQVLLWLLTLATIALTYVLVHRVEPSVFPEAKQFSLKLLASVHAVLLAPVLEELCYRQLAISPFRRRRAQITVCVVMALLFGILHVRNFLGASIDAMLYGLVFIWTRNIWYAILLHVGHNLMATLLAVYCMLGFGDIQMSRTPVIILPDTKVVVAAVVMAVIGLVVVFNFLCKGTLRRYRHEDAHR